METISHYTKYTYYYKIIRIMRDETPTQPVIDSR